jgi:hypothetical protein
MPHPKQEKLFPKLVAEEIVGTIVKTEILVRENHQKEERHGLKLPMVDMMIETGIIVTEVGTVEIADIVNFT